MIPVTVSTHSLVSRLRVLEMLAVMFGPNNTKICLAAEIEEELEVRVKRLHPDAKYDGAGFTVPFPPRDPQREVFVAPADFDQFATLYGVGA